ncbi:hypothetical protein B0I35DRAFT_476726 [Stachybotrys elegans]|uniref:C2H2-type domain-containing protein n=1 Tax=Stachybotrys elegans TaxID=80388 RepID=A0A8K0WT26_9HYPO|nr:hypothetical protein B0I35DRAFT_476726 [Stachybotrys elegans]
MGMPRSSRPMPGPTPLPSTKRRRLPPPPPPPQPLVSQLPQLPQQQQPSAWPGHGTVPEDCLFTVATGTTWKPHIDPPWQYLAKQAPVPGSLLQQQPPGDYEYLSQEPQKGAADVAPPRALSYDSFASESSPTGSLMSTVQTDLSDTMTAIPPVGSRGPTPLCCPGCKSGDEAASCSSSSNLPTRLMCLGPQCNELFQSEKELNAHVQAVHKHSCSWTGCEESSFSSREGLVWHVKLEHLLVCPVQTCGDSSCSNVRILRSHIAVAHPEVGAADIKEWVLPSPPPPPPGSAERDDGPRQHQQQQLNTRSAMPPPKSAGKRKAPSDVHQGPQFNDKVLSTKRKCLEQLRSVIERKAKKTAGTPRAADSPTDIVRNRFSKLVETASFPIVFEHAVLPFLAELMPRWSGPGHAITVTRGRTAQMRRICIMTRHDISRVRKITIAGHTRDLLPENFRHTVSFVFSTGRVERMVWARGLGESMPDDVCAARNPYLFSLPCMGDSVGIPTRGNCRESTATLGPCLIVGGASYWLSNFHPFVEAYQSFGAVNLEHPSPEDRLRCMEEAHDALDSQESFRIGDLQVTSGLNLKTTRISHDSYWEDCCKDPPLVVMDWALTSAQGPRANMLRRFPSETQPVVKEPLVRSVVGVSPGASVLSSGRTSGYQRGQVCEIPAYVSGDENGTEKATREWFVEEPEPFDSEDAWISGGIGVPGDSGAAIVDAESNSLVGQLWGRNAYWGPGPRITYFTPISDIFDDIQEKCGQQERPQLPQYRDDSERYAAYPSCRQCYDLRLYLDSRRSSRLSLQSMVIGPGDAGEQDLTSVEAISELATPRDMSMASFNMNPDLLHIAAHSPGTPMASDMRSPYATTLDVEDLQEPPESPAQARGRKRSMPFPMENMFAFGPVAKRSGNMRRGGM